MKRILSLILAFVLLFAVSSVSSHAGVNLEIWEHYYISLYQAGGMAGGPPTVIGDPTGNGTIDASDALLTLVNALWGPRYMYANPDIIDEEKCMQWFEKLSLRFYAGDWNQKVHDPSFPWQEQWTIILYCDAIYQCYLRDSYFVCDVTNDCAVSAEDALMILQYAVGKREAFPRTDYTGQNCVQYMFWPEEWYPTMYYDMRVKDPAYYDSVARYFPEIPPMDQP